VAVGRLIATSPAGEEVAVRLPPPYVVKIAP
jgi:hypothetical protein